MVKSKNIHKNIFNLNSAENKNIQFSLGHQNNIIIRKNSAFEKIWSKPKPNTGRRPIFKECVQENRSGFPYIRTVLCNEQKLLFRFEIRT